VSNDIWLACSDWRVARDSREAREARDERPVSSPVFRFEAEPRKRPEPLGVSSRLRMVIGRMSSRGGRARTSEGRPSLQSKCGRWRFGRQLKLTLQIVPNMLFSI